MVNKNLNPVKLFHQTVKNVPAYRKFLLSKKFNPSKVKTMDDFMSVPVMTKTNYIQTAKIQELFPHNKLPSLAYASSGSSGFPSLWFRGLEQEKQGTVQHLNLFKNIFEISPKEETLVIVTFSMGLWVAGNYTAACCKLLADEYGYKITVATPGVERKDILWCLKKIAPLYKRVVIAGYPPFVMDILSEWKHSRGSLASKIQVLTAGDSFSEKWRAECLKLISSKKLTDVVNVYGSADTGFLGYETKATIALRNLIIENKQLTHEFFKESSYKTPAIFEINPSFTFIEDEKGELLITTNTASPLIRYNMHDVGQIYSPTKLKRILVEHKIKNKQIFELLKKQQNPFIVKRGRTDVAVTFYALNIYPEHVQAGLINKKIKNYVSGNFFSYTKDVNNHSQQKLFFVIELASEVRNSIRIQKLIKANLIETLLRVNIEFRKLSSSIGLRAEPVVTLLPFGHKKFNEAKGLVAVNGKKPKVVFYE